MSDMKMPFHTIWNDRKFYAFNEFSPQSNKARKCERQIERVIKKKNFIFSQKAPYAFMGISNFSKSFFRMYLLYLPRNFCCIRFFFSRFILFTLYFTHISMCVPCTHLFDWFSLRRCCLIFFIKNHIHIILFPSSAVTNDIVSRTFSISSASFCPNNILYDVHNLILNSIDIYFGKLFATLTATAMLSTKLCYANQQLATINQNPAYECIWEWQFHCGPNIIWPLALNWFNDHDECMLNRTISSMVWHGITTLTQFTMKQMQWA